MKPQIRSIPLCKVECPQFCWAVRNNSVNVTAALQPDLCSPKKEEDIEAEIQDDLSECRTRDYFCPSHAKTMMAPNKSCYCIDARLRPTLFPHPATCVCSTDPIPPEDEKYRFCKVRMENQTIGDIMEEIIQQETPAPIPQPVKNSERIIKKIMRSTLLPDGLDLEDDNACVECFVRDPALMKKATESIIRKQNAESRRSSCRDPNECRKLCRVVSDSKFTCFENEEHPVEPQDKTKCKWKEDGTICTCKQERKDPCNNCTDCPCQCLKVCGRCTCNSSQPTTPKSIKRYLGTKQPASSKTITVEEKPQQQIKKTTKGTGDPEKPLISNVTEKKAGNNVKKARVKTSIEKSQNGHSPKVTVQRFQESKKNSPFRYENDKQKTNVPPVQFYEHFINSSPMRSETSSKSVITSWRRPKTTGAKAASKKAATSTSSTRKMKNLKDKPSKIPWNFNNQPKVQDPMNEWRGTKYSWSKKNGFQYGKKFEVGKNNFLRSRGGDDVGKRDKDGPAYFEYSPNMRDPDEVGKDTAIGREGKKRRKQDFGKKAVERWHQVLEHNGNKNVVEEGGKNKQKTENLKSKYVLFEDDECDENLAGNENADENYDENYSFHEHIEFDNHDKKQCLQCLMDDVQQKYLGSPPDVQERPSSTDRKMKEKKSENTSGVQLKKKNIEESQPHDQNNNDEYYQGRQEELNYFKTTQDYQEFLENYNEGIHDPFHGNPDCNRSRPRSAFEQQSIKLEQNITRPKTSVGCCSEEPIEKPFFNVVKQRIHARNKTLEDLEKFREEHFFETHGSNQYLQDIPEHTCVHRFTVDERLFPKALHSDESGVSCCIHCDKPMKNEKSIFLDQRDSKVTIVKPEVQRQISKFSLRPKPVHIGCKDSLIEIKLEPEHNGLFQSEKDNKSHRIFHADSMALRHQKR